MSNETKSGVHLYRWVYAPVTTDELRLDDLLMKQYFYDQHLVKEIIPLSNSHVIQKNLGNPGEYLNIPQNNPFTIKIEGMEKLNRKMWALCDLTVNGPDSRMIPRLPSSCHVFIASGMGAPSFLLHTDPDPVTLYVIEGEKHVWIPDDDKTYELKAGMCLRIPPGVRHRISNPQANIMLSIGHDRWHTEKMDD